MASCPFDICDGSGLVFDEERREAADCRCRPQVIARQRARSLSAVIPEKYKGIGFDRFPVTEIDPNIVRATRRFCDRIDENLDAGQGLWYFGGPGTGKTTLAMLVTQATLEAGRSAARYSLPGLLSQIRKTFSDDSHNDLLERLTAVDLLHIDDVGAQQTTPWVLEELYAIINARYEEKRSIIITTNLEHDDLSEQINERTVSRLAEMCEMLPLHGEDKRVRTFG